MKMSVVVLCPFADRRRPHENTVADPLGHSIRFVHQVYAEEYTGDAMNDVIYERNERVQNRFDLGFWIMAVFGVIGFMTSVSTAKSCLRSLLKARDEASSQEKPPISFNDHN